MSDDCEVPDFYCHSEPKARKEHSCCECKAPILKGEVYFCVSMKFEGELSRERQHLDCMAACMAARDFQDECVYYGGLKEWWQIMKEEAMARDSDLSAFRDAYAKVLRRERPYLRARVTP